MNPQSLASTCVLIWFLSQAKNNAVGQAMNDTSQKQSDDVNGSSRVTSGIKKKKIKEHATGHGYTLKSETRKVLAPSVKTPTISQ